MQPPSWTGPELDLRHRAGTVLASYADPVDRTGEVGGPVAQHTHDDGTECDVAHGHAPLPARDDRRLVVVYASPLGSYLLHWGRELGFSTTLVEPDTDVVTRGHRAAADTVLHDPANVEVTSASDVVVSDHHRADLGAVLAPLVRARPRWIGIIGSPRHEGPHRAALEGEGVDPELIATVRRPIGLDIGSKSPAEIAVSILAGLLADRNGRSGGLPRPPARTTTSTPG